MNKAVFSKLLPKRKLDSHKGDYGHVVVIAGSTGLTGAAALCAQAALVSGSGLVTLGIPKSLNIILETKLTEVMTRPLPELNAGCLSKRAYSDVMKLLINADVIAIGPGLSRNKETLSLVRRLLVNIDRPIVLDADGLYAVVGNINILKKVEAPLVITPHPGEMAALLNISIDDVQRNRNDIPLDVAKKFNVVVVLKGHKTVVASPKGKVYFNDTGNPGMATAGSGDVLTGMIASFIGQNTEPFEASKFSVYIHGLAGDLAAKEVGEISLIASDILAKLPQVIKDCYSGS